jgi:hypothetical protein
VGLVRPLEPPPPPTAAEAAVGAAAVLLAPALAAPRKTARGSARGPLQRLVWRLRRGSGRAGSVGGTLAAAGATVECGGGSSLGHGEFFNLKLSPYLEEARQGVGAAEMEANGLEPLVEAANDVEDEGAGGGPVPYACRVGSSW